MFNNIPAVDFSAFAAPIQKIIDLNTAVISKTIEAQQAAAKEMLNLSQARTKAALEIKDVDDFSAFVTEQSEIAQSSFQELTESTQVATEDAKAYFAEVQAILSESSQVATEDAKAYFAEVQAMLTESQEVVAKVAPASKPVAKKAA